MTDDECSGIDVYHGVDSDGYHFFLECWKPNLDDIEAIKKGDPIWIKIIAVQLSPLEVFTMSEDNKSSNNL